METTTSIRRRLLTALAIVLLGGSAMACANEADDGVLASNEETTTTTEADDVTDGDADEVTDGGATDGAGATTGGDSGGSSSGGSSTGGSSTGGTSGGSSQPPAAAKPVIDAFTTPESIDCHNGSFQQFTASWSTTNATKVTISIDGPGIYDTYGPVGEVTLPFSCETSHTFLLTAYGADGSTTAKEITLQPRNVQSAASEDVEDV